MWRACQPTGCSEARCSRISPPHPGRVSYCCASAVTPTPQESPGRARTRSPQRRACSAPASARRSRRSSIRASSSSSLPAVKGAATRPDISSSLRASYGPLGSPYFGSSYGPLGMRFGGFGYGPLGSHEVDSSHREGSAELQGSQRCIAIIGQLAARCPSGEEAQGEVTSGVGHGLARSRSRWLVKVRWQDARSRRPACGSIDADDVAGTQRNHRADAAR